MKQTKITVHTPTIDAYLRSVKHVAPISKEEEKELFNIYKTASPAEKNVIANKFASANQLSIFSMAKTYAHGDEDKILDYVNEGTIGLLNAVEKFDVNSGNRFFTFAQWYIRQAMTNYSQTTDQFMRKSNAAKFASKIRKFKTAFYQENHRDPSLDEIKEGLEEMGMKVKDIRDLDTVYQNSINSCISDDDDAASFETNPKFINKTAVENDYEKEVDAEDKSSKVSVLLSNLDERSRTVIKQLFGIGYENPMDIEVVAERLGLTTTRVGQIKKAALKKLQQLM